MKHPPSIPVGTSSTPASSTNAAYKLPPMSTEPTPRCSGTNSEGQACEVPPALLTQDADGRHWCSSHDPSPEAEQRRKLASMRGGEATRIKHRKIKALDPGELGTLDTPEDAARWTRIIAEAVATGRLSTGAANAATRAVSQWLSARDLHVRETRLGRLEAEVERIRGGTT